jgi:hypothetical protein
MYYVQCPQIQNEDLGTVWQLSSATCVLLVIMQECACIVAV